MSDYWDSLKWNELDRAVVDVKPCFEVPCPPAVDYKRESVTIGYDEQEQEQESNEEDDDDDDEATVP